MADNRMPALVEALAEGRRAIDAQRESLADLRSRSGSLIGYAALVATLTASLGDLGRGWAIAGGVVGGVAALCGVYVLVPRTMTFGMDAGVMVEDIQEVQQNEILIQGWATAHQENYAENKPVMKKLHRSYLWGIYALMLETLVLATAVVVR